MNEENKKRRASILKKRQSTEDDQTETINKFPKKSGIQFSQKKQVKEFMQCEENVTIWGNTYETSVAKSESSDSSSNSRKISVDFTHSAINMTNNETASMVESQKENIIVEENLVPRMSEEQRQSISSNSSASSSIEMTIDMNHSERKRVHTYGTDNLNITNMPLDNSLNNKFLNVPGKQGGKVLSPRKMIFINKQSNVSVIIKDKVLMDKSELDDNVSVSIEDDERTERLDANRKTIYNSIDMNISTEIKPQSKYNLTSSISDKKSATTAPKTFKVPGIPNTLKFQPQSYESPPIKPIVLKNQKEEIDELFEMMVSDTPSKNLCCIGNNHTPNQSSKKAFSAQRPTPLRKSIDIFREIGLFDDEENPKSVRRTIFHDDSITLDKVPEKDVRKTTFEKMKMDETVLASSSNETQAECNLDISVEAEIKNDCQNKSNEAKSEEVNVTSNKSLFDLNDDYLSVPRHVPMMINIKSFEHEIDDKSLHKRSILSNDTCNTTNFLMQLTNIDDTGGSLETTNEIQRKAARILRNPHSTLGSNSINSPFPDEITDSVPRCVFKSQKSLILEPKLENEVINKSAMKETGMSKFNDDSNISGITDDKNLQHFTSHEMSFDPISQGDEEIKVNNDRLTTYANKMDITGAGINNEVLKSVKPASSDVLQKTKRVTTYENNMDMSEIELEDQKSASQIKHVPFEIYASENDKSAMEMTKVSFSEKYQQPGSSKMENNIFKDSGKRVTTYGNEMNISTTKTVDKPTTEIQAQTNPKRATTYDNHPDIEDTENYRQSKTSSAPKSSKRTTTYANNMDITGLEHHYETNEPSTSTAAGHSKRVTTYANEMNISGTQNFNELHKIYKKQPESKRITTYDQNMDIDATGRLTQTKISSDEISKMSNKRITTYANNIDITGIEIDDETIQSTTSVKAEHSKRMTTYANRMDLTGIDEDTSSIKPAASAALKQPKRITTYENNMDMSEMELEDLLPHQNISLKTPFEIYASNSYRMELTNQITNPMRIHVKESATTTTSNSNKRVTTYANEMNISGTENLEKSSKAQTSSNRFTIYTNKMDISGIEYTDKLSHSAAAMQNSLKRATTYANKMDLSAGEISTEDAIGNDVKNMSIEEENRNRFKSRATEHFANNMDMSESEQASLGESEPQAVIYEEPIVVDSPTVHFDSNKASNSPLHKKRATTYNMEMSYLSVENNRATTYKAEDLDMSTGDQEERRNIFTIDKRRDSMKWHNITETELLNMIDDESNPCVNDASSIPLSSEPSNVSKYEEAMEDFMNITVKASPLNCLPSIDTSAKSRRQSRIPSPIRDYSSMFDSLLQNLKKKDIPKPRLEIDEYLEKLKIEPIKIPIYPQNQEGYLEKKLNEMLIERSARKKERQRLKKENQAMQFPQIPTEIFLLKNLFDCADEEILNEIQKNGTTIAPVFPEAIDFERLLNNKFKNDEYLSKYWYFSSVYWSYGNFKLTHKKLPMFTLNINCQQYSTEADDSTIPIIFKDVILYLNPHFRKSSSQTRRNLLLRKEFHRFVHGVDNFTSMCETSSQLFEFVEYYHANVLKAIEVVDNVFLTVNKYKAIYRMPTESTSASIFKRCFLLEDIVDIEIFIDGYVEDTAVNHLFIKGREFEYTIKPYGHANQIRGLMLIELILFDTEKFLATNAQRTKFEDDEE